MGRLPKQQQAQRDQVQALKAKSESFLPQTLVEPIFEQQPGEFPEEYVAFTEYLQLGPGRTFHRLCEILREKAAQHHTPDPAAQPVPPDLVTAVRRKQVTRLVAITTGIYPAKYKTLAAKNRWEERSFVYDYANGQLQLKQWTHYQQTLRAREWDAAQSLLDIAEKNLRRYTDPETAQPLTFEQILETLHTASKLGRLATGLSLDGKTTASQITQQITGHVLTVIGENPDPILRQLEARLHAPPPPTPTPADAEGG